MVIKKNPNAAERERIAQAIADNDGYCCCAIVKTPETKCMCKAFREQEAPGPCHCGLYYKAEAPGTKKRPLGYLGGDIMSFGSNLARQYEYDEFLKQEIPVDVYSPVMNKSINDKANMTEEENNHLAEKITSADIERLWNSDFVVMCPEQSAIGSLCETGCLYGWKYLTEKLLAVADDDQLTDAEKYTRLVEELRRINAKKDYFHYFDIRTNHLNEKDWRRSFSINQLLYGMILYTAEHGDFETFPEIMEHLKEEYNKDE